MWQYKCIYIHIRHNNNYCCAWREYVYIERVTNQLTRYTEQSPSLGADSFGASREFSHYVIPQMSVSWVRWPTFMPSHSIPLRFVSILQSQLRLCCPCRSFPSDFSKKILFAFPFYRLTCRIHLILFVLITVKIFGEKQGRAGLVGTLAITAIDKARRNHVSKCTLWWLVQIRVRKVRWFVISGSSVVLQFRFSSLVIFFTLSKDPVI